MTFSKGKRDFKIAKPGIMGSPKPNKVEVRKVSEHASGMKMAEQKGSFGNFGT